MSWSVSFVFYFDSTMGSSVLNYTTRRHTYIQHKLYAENVTRVFVCSYKYCCYDWVSEEIQSQIPNTVQVPVGSAVAK